MLPLSRSYMLKRIGNIHFIGIGGIGMSGIAEILHNLGYKVQGSDISMSSQVKRLMDIGINVHIGHKESNIENANVVIRSSAVNFENPEIKRARELNIPIIQRAEMLAELMRLKTSIAIAGTHGKTTTTSLVASIFEQEGLAPTVINGGIINSKLTNAYLGEGEFLIAEADESDGTFTKLPATIAVVTNINPDHMEYFKDFDTLKDYFCKFIENIPFYGFAVLCKDHDVVSEIADKIMDRRIITYGINNPKADVFADNIRKSEENDGMFFDVIIGQKIKYNCNKIENCFIPVMGIHNVQNSLAAISIGLELNFDVDNIRNAFKSFKGVKRRFTKTGEVAGVSVIDDYAHHPEEIKATIKTARQVIDNEISSNIINIEIPESEYEKRNKVVVIFQPHRYTRFAALLEDFKKAFDNADYVFILDIYSAGEEPIIGANKERLVSEIKSIRSNAKISGIDSADELPKILTNIIKEGDLILCMGAGSITSIANALPAQMIYSMNSVD